MRNLVIFPLLVAAPLAIAPAATPVDNYGAAAIIMANYSAAEAQLEARLARAPADHPALLNLAHVYRHTARATDANVFYGRILNRANVELETLDGRRVWSHDVARAGISGTVTVAMR